ncbi:sortase domain-bontaining protein [Streptomyces sp. DT171]|uniref:sortase domain-containing protein n=1 Tax=Streptomyces sp. DT171 TaxID=3416524 RepID=UPI003CF6A3B5
MKSRSTHGKGRRGACTAAAVLSILAGAVAMGVAVVDRSGPPPRPVAAGTVPTDRAHSMRTARPVDGMSRSVPTVVRIPDVGMSVPLVPVQLSGDGKLPLPEDRTRASWLASSVTPGERGTSVIAGHVDAREGPAAFYQLSAVKPGMRIEVRRTDGTTARFTVDAVAVYPQDDFPDATVYGPTPGPSLRLLTCTGWDANAHEYRDNVVIYATPTPTPTLSATSTPTPSPGSASILGSAWRGDGRSGASDA